MQMLRAAARMSNNQTKHFSDEEVLVKAKRVAPYEFMALARLAYLWRAFMHGPAELRVLLGHSLDGNRTWGSAIWSDLQWLRLRSEVALKNLADARLDSIFDKVCAFSQKAWKTC